MNDHDDRYFMTCVKLHGVKNRIERILTDSKEHSLVPSIELMSACLKELGEAMVEVHRSRLSDPRYKELRCQLCAKMKCEFCKEP